MLRRWVLKGLLANRDFLAGLLLLVFGGLVLYVAREYPMGRAARMGPGYFPIVLGYLLCFFGVWVGYRGLRSGEKVKGEWGWRPLSLITLSIVLFGYTLEKAGVVPSLVLLFFVAAAGGREFRTREVAVLAAVMSAFAAGVFIYALKLPYPLFGGH